MKRSPLRRRSPLRAKKPDRGAARRKARLRAEVSDRSGGWCELVTEHFCTGRATEMHHRRMRSQCGADVADNILHLCARAHRLVHARPDRLVDADLDWSYRHGLLLRGSSSGHPPPHVDCPPDCAFDHSA